MTIPLAKHTGATATGLSERHYRVLMENMSDAILLLNETGHVLYQSPSVERITGFSSADTDGKTVFDAVHPDDVKNCIDFFKLVFIHPGVPQTFTYRLLHKSGRYISIEGTINNLLHDPHIKGFILNYRDVTDRVASHRKAAKEEQEYNLLIQNLPVAIYTCDMDGYIQLYNKAAVNLWGREPEIGKDRWCGSWQSFESDGTPLPAEESAMAITLKQRRVVNTEEIVMRRPDGMLRHVKPYPSLIVNSEGIITGTINLMWDVTDKKLAGEKLRLQKRALDSAIGGVIITDARQADHPIIFANQGFYKLTGFDQKEVMGKNCRFLQGPETSRATLDIIKKCIAHNKPFEGEIINYKKDGTPFWNHLRIAPVPDDEGNIMHFVGFQNDITEKKNIELELANTLKDLEQRVIERTTELSILNSSLTKEVAEKNAMGKELFQSREMYSKTLQSMGDGVIATDPTGAITFMNNSAEFLTGIHFESVKNLPIEQVCNLLLEGTDESVENPVRTVLLENRYVFVAQPTQIFKKYHGFYNVDCSAAPIHNDKRELTGAVMIIRDITDQAANRRKLEGAYNEIAEKNKTITDSIQYAQRLQKALFPDSRKLKSHFSKSFVINKPQHIVGGDFYWLNTAGDKTLIATVDCTGHGVPGAFMSIIAIELLNKIISERNCHQPSEILRMMDNGITNSIGLSSPDGVADGMDMSLCSVDRNRNVIEFSGAMNPIIIASKGEVKLYRGSRFGIGGHISSHEKQFETCEIPFEPGDMLYMFSDGYRDQFGGERNKKFMISGFQKLIGEIHMLPTRAQKDIMIKTFESWRGQNSQTDDVMVLGMEL